MGHPSIQRGRAWGRALMVVMLLVVIGGIAAWIAIPRLLDINTYRSTIAAEAARRLGRPLTMGRMEFTAFPQPTVVVHDLAVEGRGLEGPSVLRVATLRAQARLMPLLTARRVELVGLTLDAPEIALVRAAPGRWNWQEMLEPKAAAEGGRTGTASSGSSHWQPSQVTITHGTVRVLDEQAENGRVLSWTLRPLDLDLQMHGRNRPVDLGLDLVLAADNGRGSLHYRGRVGPVPSPFQAARLPLDGDLVAERFPLRVVLPYLQREDGIRMLDGFVTSDLHLEVQPGSELQLKGDLELDQVHYALGGAAPRSGLLDFAAKVDLSSMNGRHDLDIRRLELDLPDGRLAISGEVRNAAGGGRMALRVDGSQVNLRALEPMATLAGFELPIAALGARPFDVQGTIERQAVRGAPRLVLRDVRLRGIAATINRSAPSSWSAAAPGAQSPSQLEVENLSIEKSILTLQDPATGPAGAIRLTDVDLEVDRYGAGRPGRGALAATLPEGGKLSFEGTLGPAVNGQLPIDGQLELAQAKLAALRPLMGGNANLPAAGEVDLDATIRGRAPEQLALKGTAALRQVPVDLGRASGGTTREVMAGNVAFDVTSEQNGRRLVLRACQIKLPSGTFALTGTLDRQGAASIADLSVAPTRLKIEELQKVASWIGVALPGAMRSPDPIEIAVRARGNLKDRSQLRLDGTLKTTRLTWEAPFVREPLQDVAANVLFTGDGCEAKGFTATLGETTWRGDLALRDLGAPRVNFALTSDRADLGKLMSALTARPGSAPGSGSAGTGMNKVVGGGTIAIQSGTFNTLAFSDLRATVALEGGTIRLRPLAFGLYAGKYAGESTVDLRGAVPIIRHDCALVGVDANGLLSTNNNLKDVLHGILSARFSGSGSGQTMDALLGSLVGAGDFKVVNGTLSRSSMLKGLSEVAGLFGERTLTQLSQRMTTNETPFSALTADFRVANGELTTDNLSLQTNDFGLAARGLVALDRRLSFQGRIVFSDLISRTLREEGSRAVYLGAENGRVAIPVAVSGTLDRPSFAVDFGAAAGYAVSKTITDRLVEAFERRQAPKSSPATPPPTDAPPATRPPSTPPPPAEKQSEPPPAKAPAEIRVRVDSHEFRGNREQPDVAIKGAVSGSHLAALLVVVTDGGGQIVRREKRLVREIAAAYGTRPHSEPMTVPFEFQIAGNLLPAKAVKMTLMAMADNGQTSPPVSFEKPPAGAVTPTE